MRSLVEVIKDLNPSWEIDLDDGDIVLDLIVVGRVVRLDAPPGRGTVVTSTTDGTDSVVHVGVLRVALELALAGWETKEGGPD